TRVLEEIKDLPLRLGNENRSVLAFLNSYPGFNVNATLPGDSQQIGRSSHMGIGGSGGFQSSFEGYTIDGVSAAANLTPSLEEWNVGSGAGGGNAVRHRRECGVRRASRAGGELGDQIGNQSLPWQFMGILAQ